MRAFAIGFCWASCLLFELPAVYAQHAVIQEPSLESFGVGTTVSVPDRGRTSLGGVGRSAASRSMYGPVRHGTSMGLSTQGSGLAVGVRVHDLAEMDREALATADRARRTRDDFRLPASADYAYETLRNRPQARVFPGEASGAIVTNPPTRDGRQEIQKESRGPSSEKLLERARQAETAGKRELALAFLRVARDQGAAAAQQELDRLTVKRIK